MRKFNKAGQAVVFSTVLLLLAAGCSSTPTPVSPVVTPTLTPNAQPDKLEILERLNEHYLAWHGVPYKIGGNDKRGIDCSGFVHLTYKKALGVSVPRSTKLLSQTGKAISRKQLTVGDLVFFKTGFAKQHVGIYMGNGQFIHASTSNGVMKSNLKSPYWSKHYWKSNRILSI
ncbi:MAG: hypothetical protein AMJ53_01770 [Gammaproteobacteria bacterium SG8_11]|nr:MAG: hypothetical protein AMJ53_01770 [Gammaproteobacteria bacterium SG8_11]